jgi:hypothetical protein
MNVEEQLKKWAAKRLDVPVEEVLSVTFRHEDGWGNDSGTWWPEENTAVIKLKGKGTKPRTREFATDGYESIPELLKEILES